MPSRNSNIIQNKEESVIVYPTVIVDNEIKIETNNLDQYNYILLDVNGKKIAMKSDNTQNSILKLDNISNGIYFLKVYSKQFQKTFKLIKQ